MSGSSSLDEAAAIDLNSGGGRERGTTSVEAESASDPGGGERGESTVETLEEGRLGFVGSGGADRAQKPEIDAAEEGGVAGADRVSGTVVPEGVEAGIEAGESCNGIGMELLEDKVASFQEKGQGDVANEMNEHDLVVGCFQDTEAGNLGSRGQEMGDGCGGDQELIADALETGNMLGKAKTEGWESVADLGGNQEEVVEVRNGTKFMREDESCPEKTASAMNDVRSGDLVDWRARASNVGPGELVAIDELGGDQKLESDVEAGSVTGVAQAATTGIGGAAEVDGLESEPANGGKIDVMETGLKEDELYIEKEQSTANDVMGHDLVDEHLQDKEGVLGPEALETEERLGSKQKSEINVVDGQNVVEYEEGTELMKKQITNQNLDCEVRGQDLVDELLQAPEGDVRSIALEAQNELRGVEKLEANVGDAGFGVEKLEANVGDAGFGVETAQTHATVALARAEAESLEGVAGLGQIQVGIAEFSNQLELTEGGLSCPEEDKSAVGEVTDLQAAEGAPGPKVAETENILDGYQRPEPGVVEVGCLTGASKTQATVNLEAERLKSIPDLGRAEHKVPETSNGTELTEQGVSCPLKSQSMVTEKGGYDLAYIHLQALEGDSSSQNQSVNMESGTKDMDTGLSMGSNQVSQTWPTGCESEVVEGSMASGDQDKDLKASVSQMSLVVTNQNDQEAGYAIHKEETKVDLLPVGDGTVEQADHVIKDSDLPDSGVEVSYPDSCHVNDHPVDGGQIVIADVKANLAKSVVDAALSADKHPTDGNARDKLDIITADGSSVLDATIMESESRGMKLVDEISSDKGDITMANSCPDLESDFAGMCPPGVQTAEPCPLDSVLKDSESAVTTGLPMTSELSVSQQSKIIECISDKNQEMESRSIGLLADSSDDAVIHEAESSPGICQDMDMESRVLKDETALTEARHEKARDSEGGKMTPLPVESVANIVIGAGDTAEQNVQVDEREHSKIAENQVVKQVGIRPGTSGAENDQHASYFVHLQDRDTFSISDLVWGKVKSHPWWPGQIFDPSDASDLAMKYQKKDNFLVVYFGDKTFAWCEEPQLKPFEKYFSQIEKQSSSDAFVNAVNDALGEVSRRIELGMTCFCLPEETYANIEHQTVDNAGIRERFSSSVFDRSLVVDYFEPDRLLEYIKALAQLPNGVANKLESVIAQAQLKAFYRSKGYPELPVFHIGGGLMENDAEVSPSDGKLFGKDIIAHSTPIPMEPDLGMRKRGRGRPSNKEKQMLEDAKKQKNLSELMEKNIVSPLANGGKIGSAVKVDDDLISHSSKKKRKSIDFDSDCSERSTKKRLDSLGDLVMKSPSPTPTSSFKVGECIRRVASQLTGSPPILRCHGETFQKSVSKAEHRRFDVVDTEAVVNAEASTHTAVENPRRKKGISEDYFSLDEMLSQLCLAARDPMKGYSSLSMIVSYFTDFRNFCVSSSSKEKKNSQKTGGKRGRKRTINSQLPSSDVSTPDHMQDSYWSDMIYHNSSANDLKRKGDAHVRSLRKRRKSGRETSLSLPLDCMSCTARHLEVGTISPQMKQALTTERSVISLEEKIVDECTPTALILSFNGSSPLPSQTDLIRIFSRYGPLKETETEVQRKTNRVKVVFKKRADAEIAFSSAGKFSIFGPALLSYCLRYLLATPNASPNTTPQGKNDAGSIEGGKLEVPNEASPNTPSPGKNDAVSIECGNSEVPGNASPNTTTQDKNDAVPIEGDNVGVPGDASPNTTPPVENVVVVIEDGDLDVPGETSPNTAPHDKNDAVPSESCNLELPGSVAPDIAPQNKNDAVHIEGGNVEVPGSVPNTTQRNNDSVPAECGNLEVPDDTYPNTTQGKKDATPIKDRSLEVPGNASPNATTQDKNDAALIENGSLDVPGNTSPSATTQDKNDSAPIEDDSLGVPGNTYPNTTAQDKNDAALVEVNLEVPGKAEIIVVSDVMQVEVVDKGSVEGSVEGIVQVDTQSS